MGRGVGTFGATGGHAFFFAAAHGAKVRAIAEADFEVAAVVLAGDELIDEVGAGHRGVRREGSGSMMCALRCPSAFSSEVDISKPRGLPAVFLP